MESLKQSSILRHFSPKSAKVAQKTNITEAENKNLVLKSAKESLSNGNSTERRSLKTIQPTREEGLLTRGTPNQTPKPQKPSKIHTCKKAITVYEDPVKTPEAAAATVDDSTQTDFENCWCKCHEDQEQLNLSSEELAHQLMVQEEIPETYWKEMAEQRRDALNETLEENEQLHKVLNDLKQENRRLSELADQGDQLAKFLQDVADDDSKEESEEENKEKEEIEEKKEKEDVFEKEKEEKDS